MSVLTPHQTTFEDAESIVLAVSMTPFSEFNDTRAFEAGSTLAEMVDGCADMLPPDFASRGTVTIAGNTFAPATWKLVRPKPGHQVGFCYLPTGGGSGGGNRTAKAALAVVIAIATVLTAGQALAGTFAVGSLFAAGSTSARLLAAGITLLGNAAARAVSATPASPAQEADSFGDVAGPASIQGNRLAGGAPIPRVLGTRNIFPPLLTQPLVERQGEDEVAEAVFALAGPHEVSNLRVNGGPVDQAQDVEIEIREGLDNDRPLGSINRYGHTRSVNAELSAHSVEVDDENLLTDQAQPANALPEWMSSATAKTFDECWLHFVLPEGLTNTTDEAVQALPLRIRIRPSGTVDWINLPELHFAGDGTRELRPTVKLAFSDPPDQISQLASNGGFIAAYARTTDQSAPASPAWEAHSSFAVNASGVAGVWRGSEGASGLQRVGFNGNEVTIHLDPAIFNKGRYDIQIKRGAVYERSDFDFGSYAYPNSVSDFFHYRANGTTFRPPRSRANLADRAFLTRVISVVNEHPVDSGKPAPRLTLFALRVKNRDMSAFAVTASGLMETWDGSAFTGLSKSSNPADQFHHVLTSGLAAKKLPRELVDTASLSVWHTACVAQDYRCDMVVEQALTAELLSKVAGTGFARPRQSELWGVIRDYDRSGEMPVQIFSPRNASSLSVSVPLSDLPDQLRGTFVNTQTGSEDYPDEVLVTRPGREGVANPLTEEVRYEGLTDPVKVLERAEFDVRQAEARAAVYSWNAPAEAIRCTRGDLVGYVDQALDKQHAAARIDALIMDGDDLTGFILDTEVPIYDEPDMHQITNMHAVKDMHLVGLKTACMPRSADGDYRTLSIAGSGTRMTDEIRLATPLTLNRMSDGRLPIARGTLVFFGPAGEITRRLIISKMEFQPGLTCRIEALAEASGLHQ